VHYHDGTVNLHRHMYGMRSGRVDDVFTIEELLRHRSPPVAN
jgi:hypothetical protein